MKATKFHLFLALGALILGACGKEDPPASTPSATVYEGNWMEHALIESNGDRTTFGEDDAQILVFRLDKALIIRLQERDVPCPWRKFRVDAKILTLESAGKAGCLATDYTVTKQSPSQLILRKQIAGATHIDLDHTKIDDTYFRDLMTRKGISVPNP